MEPLRSASPQVDESVRAQLEVIHGQKGADEVRLPLEKLLVQAIRAGMYVFVLALAIVHHLSQSDFYSWEVYRNFYFVAVLGLALPVLSLPVLNGFFAKRFLLAGSFAIDVVLITALLLTSRLNQSVFLFLYLMVIILGGLVFQVRGAMMLALTSSLLSTLVLMLGDEIKSLGFFFMLSLNNIAFFSVAWISGFLAEQLEIQGLNISDLRRLNQTIVDTIPAGLLTVLEGGEIIQANPSAVSILGESLLQAEEKHQTIREFFPTGTFAEWPLPAAKEVRIAHSNETQILSVKMLPQELGHQTTYLMVIEDETQVRKLEFAVRQSEKMAAVGQLATGIAHEIRNPLAGISGSIELLSQTSLTDDDKRLTKIILKEIDRLNNLISEFLDFAKPEKPPVEPVNLAQLLDETLNQVKLNKNIRPDIQFERSGQGEAVIRGHRDKLKQAFLNMMINSCQAFNETEKPVLSVRHYQKGDRVAVEIRDNGCGMSEDVMRRMFEPFMTTKPRGTGLGLAITHKIIQTHQAQIFVESRPKAGTQITLEFPTYVS